MKSRAVQIHWILGLAVAAGLAGCRSPLFRGQSPDEDQTVDAGAGAESEGVELVRKMAVPSGQTYLQVEGIGLVMGLRHTGCDPPPSPLKEQLLNEMETHSAPNPKQILASDETAMVHVRALIPPGAHSKDRIDVEVRVPRGSKTTDLSGGWLMITRLREHARIGRQVRTGRVLALAQGNIVTDAVFSGSKDKVHKLRGRLLGGGQVQQDRSLGLQLREEYASAFKTASVSAAINKRFHHFENSSKQGVAKPINDVNIQLAVPARYRNNIERYIRVIRNVAPNENPSQRAERLQKLERMLHEPTSASAAALRLEAMGEAAAPVLLTGLRSPNPEVNFFAAEALAYLDVADAGAALALAARSERAFRWHALTALSTMDHVSAYDALAELLDDSSAETRYGAFRALRVRNPRDPLYKGELLGEEFVYHRLATGGEPMIHFSSTRAPELVLFGMEQRLEPPAFLFAGPSIMIKGTPDGRIKVIRFRAGADDEELIVSTDLNQVIRATVSLGGSYTDVYQALTSAKKGGYLKGRLAVNAKAHRNRPYHRDNDGSAAPVPEMFADRLAERPAEDRDHSDIDPVKKDKPKRRLFGKMSDPDDP